MKFQLRYLVQGALIAALYVLLTIIAAPISFGVVQLRVAEALCVLPILTPAAIPGLFLGCLLANFLGGAILADIIFGSLATLVAAWLAWWIAKTLKGKWGKYIAPLPAVLLNALTIGYLWAYVYGDGAELGFVLCALYVGAGQLLSCYGLGVPLLLVLERYGKRLFY